MKAQFTESDSVTEMVPQILSPKKILVPIDFSAMSKRAFQYALRFTEQFRCEIVLLHVVEPERVIAGTRPAVDVFAQLEEDTTAAEADLAAPSQEARAIVRTPLRQRCALGMHPTRSPKRPRTWTSILS
jgi:nucleotide-binding universal stress UspA family protein